MSNVSRFFNRLIPFNKGRQPHLVSPREPTVVGPGQRKLSIIGPPTTVTIGPGENGATSKAISSQYVIKPAAHPTVAPHPRPYWDERGWTRRRVNGYWAYRGSSQVFEERTGEWRTFTGQVFEETDKAVPHIDRLPPQVKRHPKWVCFHRKRDGSYYLDWRTPAADADEAIMYVEDVLCDSINNR
jgi:hypothetical protein